MKNIFIILIVAAIIFFIIQKHKNVACYYLPNSNDPKVFGPFYWKAFHDLANRIPCGDCRPEAQKFMVFFHDVINKKLGKPLFNQDNYTEVLNRLNNG